MTSKDKTRDKLVGSMRKTKADAGAGAGIPEPEILTEPVAPANAAKKRTAEVSAPSAADVPADSYQSGRRVWPD